MNAFRIAVVSVPVKDQARATCFYRDVLGFSVIEDREFMPNARWIPAEAGWRTDEYYPCHVVREDAAGQPAGNGALN